MRILISGAAGFVGSRLAASLLSRGDTVIGFDNFDPYYDRIHKDRHLRDLLPQKKFTFLQADLREPEALLNIFQQHKPDAVAHLAAMAAVRYSMLHPLIYGQVNVQGTMNLLDAARQTATKTDTPPARFVIASTGSVYGTSTPVPFLESAPADRPLAPYPASKRAMELIAHCFHHLYKIPTTIARFFNVYGPHGRPDMMPWQWTLDILANKPLTLYNAGHIKRDWTYIDDIVNGLTLALDHPFKEFEILNLGNANPVENLQFVQLLEQLLNKKATIIDTPTPPTEPLITYADITKAKTLLNYQPKTQVHEGLSNFITWLRAESII